MTNIVQTSNNYIKIIITVTNHLLKIKYNRIHLENFI